MSIDGERVVLEIEDLGRFENFKLMSYSESEEQDATDHPVESGAPKVDNLDPKPYTLELEIILDGMGKPNPYSGLPFEQFKAAVEADLALPREITPYLERYELLRRAKREGKKIKVISERGVRDELVITKIASPLGVRQARVNLSLQEIPIANTQVVFVDEVKLGLPAPKVIGVDDPTKDRHAPKGSGGRVIAETWGGAPISGLKTPWDTGGIGVVQR